MIVIEILYSNRRSISPALASHQCEVAEGWKWFKHEQNNQVYDYFCSWFWIMIWKIKVDSFTWWFLRINAGQKCVLCKLSIQKGQVWELTAEKKRRSQRVISWEILEKKGKVKQPTSTFSCWKEFDAQLRIKRPWQRVSLNIVSTLL